MGLWFYSIKNYFQSETINNRHFIHQPAKFTDSLNNVGDVNQPWRLAVHCGASVYRDGFIPRNNIIHARRGVIYGPVDWYRHKF